MERPIKVLAPMAGYTDAAFRLLCRLYGADVTVSELASADAIAYGKLKVEGLKLRADNREFNFYKASSKKGDTGALLSFFQEERPFVVQLFGKYPEKFAAAAKWVSEELRPDGIDINMGCPARKVVGSDHGAALLKNEPLACEIVEAVRANTNLPVSVKTRLGWDSDDQILEFAPKLWRAGISALILHGRTYRDGFRGKARWENIYEVKKLLPELVVIGNGDLDSMLNVKCQMSKDSIEAHEQSDKTSLDGFAIGRAAFGNPMVFESHGADNSKLIEDKHKLKNMILLHAKIAFETKGEFGLVEFRKHLLAYLKGFPGAKNLRTQAVAVKSMEDLERVLSSI
jgi:tRNA-dihydrouridine synthase B